MTKLWKKNGSELIKEKKRMTNHTTNSHHQK